MRAILIIMMICCFIAINAQQSTDTLGFNDRKTLRSTSVNSLSISNGYIWSVIAGYQRVQRITDHFGAIGRIGAGITFESGSDFALEAKTSLVIGWSRRFFEFGSFG